jgi:hypothetical protein
MSGNHEIPATIAKLVASYNRAFYTFCTKQLGSQTVAAEARMNTLFAQLEKSGWTLQYNGSRNEDFVAVYTARRNA